MKIIFILIPGREGLRVYENVHDPQLESSSHAKMRYKVITISTLYSCATSFCAN